MAHSVRDRRNALGWSARRLAEECASLGAPEITSAVIVNIEHGRAGKDGRRRRDVTVDELLVLGCALAVPPLLLLVPLGAEDEYPLAPTVTVHPHLAWKVIVGEGPPVTSDRYATRLADWHPATLTVRLHDDLQRVQDAVSQAHTELRFAEMEQDEKRTAHARTAYVESLKPLARVLDSLVEAGLRPPPMHPDVRADLSTTGAVKYAAVLRDRPLTEGEKDDDGER